jgi:hypothetical protein
MATLIRSLALSWPRSAQILLMSWPLTLSAPQIKRIKAVLWVVCLFPLLRLTYLGLDDGLGANPIEFITHSTETWTRVGLLLALTVTPLRKRTGHTWLSRFRRLIGLFAFFHACLHFATYIGWIGFLIRPVSPKTSSNVHSLQRDLVRSSG